MAPVKFRIQIFRSNRARVTCGVCKIRVLYKALLNRIFKQKTPGVANKKVGWYLTTSGYIVCKTYSVTLYFKALNPTIQIYLTSRNP